MPNFIKLFCWVHGTQSSFPVMIDRDETIGDLRVILSLQGSAIASQLELCVANIPDTKKARSEFVFQDDDVLPGSRRISKIFPKELPEDTIHIAIQRPRK
ncbi:hypothetical protein BGX38DRAFT_359573 [Terfezia claveryi]|nr:hypothetical protein BGX38DRAFT_359573 [Terfezia claveryi]